MCSRNGVLAGHGQEVWSSESILAVGVVCILTRHEHDTKCIWFTDWVWEVEVVY